MRYVVKHPFSSKKLRVATIAAAAAVVTGLMVAPAPAAATGHGPTRYARVGHAARVPAGAHRVGAPSAGKTVSGSVALAVRDPNGLHQEALAVSNPRSPKYHQYLPKGAFAAAYGPSQSTINGVEAALRDAHLTVTSVSSNHLFVHFRGTVSQADAAFRTHIATYRMKSGRTGTATTAPLSLPAAVAPQVVSVIGLNTLLKPATSLERGGKKGTPAPTRASFAHAKGSPTPCAAATKAATDFGGLTDDELAHAYGVDGLYNAHDFGAGQTVAIFEEEPFSMTDLKTFDSCYFGKTAAADMADRLTVKSVDGGGGTGPGSGESILDIEDVSAIAPGANIEVYEAPNSASGGMDETNQIVQDDTAKVVSTSWGFCELDEINLEPGYINVENQLFEQAALQGQSWVASSGDSGSDSCAYFSPQPANPTLSNGDPDSQPFVLSVGGTTTTNANNPPSDQVWNDGNDGGAAGGGVSSVWSAPSWQQPFNDTAEAAKAVSQGGLTPCPQSANGSLCREEPDVAAQADEYTGAVTTYMASFGGWSTSGGTSSSAPLWAAMLTDINASTGCEAGNLGFVNPLLYAVASVPAQDKASFNDVTKGNNDQYDISDGEFYHAHPGYDMASGLGTPKLTGPNGQAGLASYLCALTAPGATRPKITSVSPGTVATNPSGSVTISGSGFTSATALSIGGYAVPKPDWSATNDTTINVSTVPTAQQAGNGGSGPQDGSGRALVSVTGSGGRTSLVSAAASLLYVDGTAASPKPSVSGVSAFGGPKAAGNTVTVFGSGFSATGANQITDVTIGGVPATNVHVVNPTTLTLTVPPYVNGTTTCKAGDDVTNDVCQAQVVVTNANGSSTKDTIQLPYTGAPFEGSSGGVPLPDCVTGGTCEVVPSTTEYDYYPTPTISSITTTSPGDSTVWASEQGDTIATIDGSGFDSLGFNWVNIGSSSLAAHQDFNIVTSSPTEVQVMINPHAPSSGPLVRNVTVQTLGGLSAPSPISYAGIPRLSSVSPPWVPDQGGGHITVKGSGFEGVAPADGGELAYLYADADAVTEQLSGYVANSATSISADTPGNNPGAFIVSVCTITFCSEPESFRAFRHSLLDFYEPGDPVVTSVSQKRGPASGGTKVVIRGHNLSDAVEVDFGSAVAEASSAPQLLTNGSNTEIDAVAPPGRAGSTVHVVVTTVESLAEGNPSAKTAAATFHYVPSVPSPPLDVVAAKHGRSVTVKWKPPASNGGHRILAYRATAVALANSPKPGAKKPAPVSVKTKNGRVRSVRLRGLRGGWFYFVKVRAINKSGAGLPARNRRGFLIHDPAK